VFTKGSRSKTLKYHLWFALRKNDRNNGRLIHSR
jgi:hypothetical protein